jgi:hypothetical protein
MALAAAPAFSQPGLKPPEHFNISNYQQIKQEKSTMKTTFVTSALATFTLGAVLTTSAFADSPWEKPATPDPEIQGTKQLISTTAMKLWLSKTF